MSTGQSFGYSQQPSYGSYGNPYAQMGGYGSMGGYDPFGSMSGYGNMSAPYNPYATQYGSSYGMSSNPYMSMGFGGGYQQPSSYNPFAGGGYGTSFGGMGNMGGFNQFGGYGQVGLGYLPPPQQTINDTVANQFMQQYYGGAFGLGAQPQPRRQRPRNPFRRDMQPLMQAQPQQDVIGERSPGSSEPVGYPVGVSMQALPYAESVVNPIRYDTAPLPESFFSPGAFNSSLLNDLNYMRF